MEQGDMPGSTNRSATASVTAGIAAASVHPSLAPEPEKSISAEDVGHSLAEMAQHDLDATLQLLAERAQYITEASGAAIALRRGEHNDMLCRASAGSNAPDLGALLSMDYGLSGESVRTRQLLRCDEAERDPRVNHEVCRKLGIASVVVMPIVTGEQVLGVFELLSGTPRAFGERDISALHRLSEMVELAVRYAVAAQSVAPVVELPLEQSPSPTPVVAPEAQTVPLDLPVHDLPVHGAASQALPVAPEKNIPPQESKPQELAPQESKKTEPEKTEVERIEPEKTEPQKASPEPSPKRPLFWSAAIQTQGSADHTNTTAESIAAPPGLRNLQKCQACGFPVSKGRAFCVECEEKKWRGQPLPKPATAKAQSMLHEAESQIVPRARNAAETPSPNNISKSRIKVPLDWPIAIPPSAVNSKTQPPISDRTPSATPAAQPSAAPTSTIPPKVLQDSPPPLPQNTPGEAPAFNSALFSNSTVESQSWLATNKYILAALLVVAIIVGVIVLLH
jgi:hypothetical protein